MIPGASVAVVPWWSFTKTLLAVCTLRLAEAGRLELDAPLLNYPFTPRQLLQHRSGVGDYGGLAEYHAAVRAGETPWPVERLLGFVPPSRLLFAPGEGWAYSNVGYLLLRQAIERAAADSLREIVDDLVLKPLHLTGSRLATTQDDMATTAYPIGYDYDPGWVYHGTVVGPPGEAAFALHGIFCGDLLSPASQAAMLDCHPVGGPIAGRPWRSTGYGLGLMIGSMRASKMSEALHVSGHSAGGPGSVGAVYHAAATGVTAAAFMSGDAVGAAEAEVLALLANSEG